jgi:hypothetical protein
MRGERCALPWAGYLLRLSAWGASLPPDVAAVARKSLHPLHTGSGA